MKPGVGVNLGSGRVGFGYGRNGVNFVDLGPTPGVSDEFGGGGSGGTGEGAHYLSQLRGDGEYLRQRDAATVKADIERLLKEAEQWAQEGPVFVEPIMAFVREDLERLREHRGLMSAFREEGEAWKNLRAEIDAREGQMWATAAEHRLREAMKAEGELAAAAAEDVTPSIRKAEELGVDMTALRERRNQAFGGLWLGVSEKWVEKAEEEHASGADVLRDISVRVARDYLDRADGFGAETSPLRARLDAL